MKALITGAQGQDGTLLTSMLRSRGYEVCGLVRPGRATAAPGLVGIDLLDEAAIAGLMRDFAPDEVYHLAACHYSSEKTGNAELDREMVRTNFYAAEILLGVVRRFRPGCRVLLAGSSQMYRRKPGARREIDEDTPAEPATFYGSTKAWARDLLRHYRERAGVFGSMVILFNHESPLRPPHFLTRKVTRAAALAARGGLAELRLLDLDAEVDWCSARDVVEGMHLALSAPKPEDYVLASGTTHRVRDVLDLAFGAMGLAWRDFVVADAAPAADAGVLVGSPRRAEERLGWVRRVGFEAMIREMVEADLASLPNGE